MRGEVAFSLRQMAFGVSPHASIMRRMVFVSCLIRKNSVGRRDTALPVAACVCVLLLLYFTTTFFVVPSA